MQNGGREPETGGLGRLAPAQAQSMPTPDAGKIFSKRNRVGMKYAGRRSGITGEAGPDLRDPAGEPGGVMLEGFSRHRGGPVETRSQEGKEGACGPGSLLRHVLKRDPDAC